LTVAKSDDDIIVCRCEDVTLGDIRRAISEGATTMDEVRRITRAGMGPCQGRTCRVLVASELASQLGKTVAEIIPSTFRPPLKAVKMGDLAALAVEEHGQTRQGEGEPSC
jgi:NAD(P)H-nitrite reductase large subunit